MAGGKIDILVNPDVKDFPKKLERGLGGSLGMASKIGASFGVAFGGAAAIKSIASLGVEFDKQLNTMKAVSQATAPQLEAVSEHARDLGKSSDLTATSSVDAAAAMTELAKAGFSVEESMAAAKGTLQLASAAQIDAASAATIQSQALQAFGLDASYAATASDILAGAANASSAEIQDVAHGLQQSGSVAAQIGLTLEDTATALAIFANAGIQGSDAGTLLKSALLAFTKETKPAKAAMEELGLSVWDADGNFVGMEQTFRELNAASSSMTKQQYATATATLFGHDAARMAGIAASEGAEGWNKNYAAVTRAGQAAEVAAAQASGLPGVLEALENQAEDTGTAVYEAFKGISLGVSSVLVSSIETAGPIIEGAAVSMAAGIESAAPVVERVVGVVADGAGEIVGALRVVGSVGSDVLGGIGTVLVPVADGVLGVSEGVTGLAGPLALAAGALAVGRWQGWGQSLEVSGTRLTDLGRGIMDSARLHEALATKQRGLSKVGEEFGDVQDATRVTMRGLTSAMETQIPAVGRAADAYRKHGAGLRTYAANSKRWAAETRAVSEDHHTLATTVITAKGAVSGFAGQLGGGVAAAGSLAKSALGGVVDFFGGPWNIAITAATFAVTGILSEIDRTRESARLLKALEDQADATGGALAQAFRSGDVSAQLSETRSGLEETVDTFASLADTAPGAFSVFTAAAKDYSGWFKREGMNVGTDARRMQMEVAESAAGIQEAFENIDLDAAAAAISGTEDEYRRFADTLDTSSDSGKAAAGVIQENREAFLRLQAAFKRMPEGAAGVADAFAVLGDEAASSADRVSALRTVLDKMFGVEVDADTAFAALHEGIRDVVDGAAAAAAAGEQMQVVFLDNGKWDLRDEATSTFREELLKLRDELLDVAETGKDVHEAFDDQGVALEALGQKYRLSTEKVTELYRQLGANPESITTVLHMETHEASKGVGTLWAMIEAGQIEAGKRVTVPVDTEQGVANIEKLGFTVAEVHEVAGKPTAMELIPDEESMRRVEIFTELVADLELNSTVKIINNVAENEADLRRLGVEVKKDRNGEVYIEANTPEQIADLVGLGILVRNPYNGEVHVASNLPDVLRDGRALDARDGNYTEETHRVNQVTNRVDYFQSINKGMTASTAAAIQGPVPWTGNAHGSVRTAASGHARLSQQEPQIAPGGSWLVWAEDETEGESFIPHAPAKRRRATQILAETARIFGLSLLDRAGSVVRRDGSNLDPERARFFSSGAVRRYGNQMIGMSRMDTWMTSEQNKRHVEQLAQERSQLRAAASEAAILLRVSQREGDKAGERQAQGLLDDLADRGVTPTAKAWAAADKWNYVRDDFGQSISDRLEKVTKAEEKRTRHLEAAQKTYGTVSEYLGAMADHAETLAQIQHVMHMERIEIGTANLTYRRGLLDTLIAEQDVSRVRAEGAVAVADAEAALRAAREAAAMKGSTSIDAMSQALDRARRTGIFAIEDVAASVIDNSAAVREAQAAVEAARVQAAANEQNAVRNLEQMKLDMAEAQLRQQAAANALAISSDEEKKLRGLLGSVTAAQGRKLAHDWNEKSYVEQLAVVGRLSEKQLAALDSKTAKQLRELQYQVAVARDAAALQRDALERSVASEQARIDAARMESELRARTEQEAYAADIEIAGLLGRIASAETAGQAQALSDAAIIAAERRDAMLAAMELGFKASTPKTTNPTTVRITLPPRAESVSRADFESVVDTLARVVNEVDIRMETSAGDYLSART